MQRWFWTCCALLLSPGCGPSNRLYLSYPDVGDHESLVLSVEADSRQQLVAIDLSLGLFAVRLAGELEPDDHWEAHALLFKADLASLKLSEGPLTESPESDPHPLLLEPDQVLSQDSTAEPPGVWTQRAETPSRFHPLRVKNEDPFGLCPEVTITQAELPDSRGDVGFMLSLAPDRALVVTLPLVEGGVLVQAQKAFVVELEGDKPIVRELALANGPLLSTATLDEAGRLWAAGLTGSLFRLTLSETDAVRGAELPGPAFPVSRPTWLHMSAEAVVVMVGGGLVYTGTRTSSSAVEWAQTALHDFGAGGGGGRYSGALFARSPTEIWLGKASSRSVLRVRHEGGRFAEPTLDRRLEGEAAIGLTALAEVEGLGILAGMTDGEIRRYDPVQDTWDSLGVTRFTQVMHDIVPTKSGFVMAGGTGLFNFYVRGEGYCPLDAAGYKGLRAPSAVLYAMPFGDGVLMVGSALGNRSQAVSWLRGSEPLLR